MSERILLSKNAASELQKKNASRSSQRNSSPPTLHPTFANPTLRLQKNLGNQEVQRLFQSQSIQAKLKVGQVNDKYEQEADHVAEQVMNMPEPKTSMPEKSTSPTNAGLQGKEEEIQKMPAIQKAEEEEVQKMPAIQKAEEEEVQKMPAIQKAEEEEIQKMPAIQKVEAKKNNEIASPIESKIQAMSNSGGEHLSKSTRNFFEPRFGQNFSQVRIHATAPAAQIARSINAKAFTHKNNIFFNSGEYKPSSEGGKKLLAHELTHVGQQAKK